ncbi:MAG: hypothetical protein H6Q52_2546 [Deltaproteobacteria bacterium]|nr:hypothetical protein [Deltaproteobacteria bacterium]
MNDSGDKAFCSWSGGKESALALYRAMRSGVNVARLVNMVTEDGSHSRTHGLSAGLLVLQAESIGIPIIQRPATWDTYEQEFKDVLREMPQKGIHRGIFGDIDLEEHRTWVERVCSECSIIPSLPLWTESRDDLLSEFIRAGFKASLVAVNKRYLDESWIGREIDNAFVRDIRAQSTHVDICGEAGEYHTFVYDGPIFKRPVSFEKGPVRSDGDHFFLDIRNGSIKGGI